MDFVEQLKSSVDIVSVVGEYVRLRKAGTRYVGLCPFHTEKTPSFGVHPAHQFYKCFGCGAGGDVIKFVMEIEGLTFYEALQHLSERYGIPMPKRTRLSDEESKLRGGIYEMHDLAQQLFRRALESDSGRAAREYIRKRGISREAVEEFGLGFADRSGQTLARLFERKGVPREQMEASGLVMRRQDGSGHFDRFRGRLMFPIHNESGKIIAFAGRALAPEDEPKYLNSPETPIYRKSFVLYNLHRARKAIRKSDYSILVEGYMDVIGLHAAGMEQAVASCGTALTEQQVRTLHRHSGRIVVNFDSDDAGTRAAERSIHMLLAEGMHIRVLELENGLDPDDYVRRRGAEAYRECIKSAPGCFHWLADRARKHFDMQTVEGRIEGLRAVLMPAIERLPDKLERAAVVEDVASYLHVDATLIRNEFLRAKGARARPAAKPAGADIPPKEKLLLNLLLRDGNIRKQVVPRLRPLSILQRFHTWDLLKTIFQLEETGGEWSYSDLEGRLGEETKALLASLVFADRMEEQDVSLNQALAFVPELEHKEREARLGKLREEAREAERSGNIEEALRLMEELNRAGEK